jgi:7-carboxy-7-deazaguanine synthase
MNTARGVPGLGEIAAIITACWLPPAWVMPEGSSSATVLARMRTLTGTVPAAGGRNLTARLHVRLLRDDERGH